MDIGVYFYAAGGNGLFYVGGGGHVAHIDGCASWFYSMGYVGIFQEEFKDCAVQE